MAHIPTEPRRVIDHTGQPCNILIPFDPILAAEELAQSLSSEPDPPWVYLALRAADQTRVRSKGFDQKRAFRTI